MKPLAEVGIFVKILLQWKEKEMLLMMCSGRVKSDSRICCYVLLFSFATVFCNLCQKKRSEVALLIQQSNTSCQSRDKAQAQMIALKAAADAERGEFEVFVSLCVSTCNVVWFLACFLVIQKERDDLDEKLGLKAPSVSTARVWKGMENNSKCDLFCWFGGSHFSLHTMEESDLWVELLSSSVGLWMRLIWRCTWLQLIISRHVSRAITP